jgi:hypothetical protein
MPPQLEPHFELVGLQASASSSFESLGPWAVLLNLFEPSGIGLVVAASGEDKRIGITFKGAERTKQA